MAGNLQKWSVLLVAFRTSNLNRTTSGVRLGWGGVENILVSCEKTNFLKILK